MARFGSLPKEPGALLSRRLRLALAGGAARRVGGEAMAVIYRVWAGFVADEGPDRGLHGPGQTPIGRKPPCETPGESLQVRWEAGRPGRRTGSRCGRSRVNHLIG